MFVNFADLLTKGDVVAVAVSGGSDSMALLHYTSSNAKKLQIKVLALNVEHGIRGESSVSDTAFVKNYCHENGIEFIGYSVDAPAYSSQNKLGLEESARILRYQCFSDAIKVGLCNKVATAHHLSDSAETMLFNLFRGSGINGITGINQTNGNKIIRPFLNVTKAEIEEYISVNKIPFVTDETNLSEDYTRNFLRLNVLPQIKKVFPEVEKSLSRFSEIAKCENQFMDDVAEKSLLRQPDGALSIVIPCHKAVFNRATIKALQALGVKKDWEKRHVDSVYNLTFAKNGDKISLPQNIQAIREYDKIVFYKNLEQLKQTLPFTVGKIDFNNEKLSISQVDENKKVNLNDGLFADLNKIPKSAVIRNRLDGDVFTKFGGGTKSLNDFFTDKKIPQRLRDGLILVADGNNVLVIFGIAISDKIKVDSSTEKIIKFNKEN